MTTGRAEFPSSRLRACGHSFSTHEDFLALLDHKSGKRLLSSIQPYALSSHLSAASREYPVCIFVPVWFAARRPFSRCVRVFSQNRQLEIHRPYRYGVLTNKDPAHDGLRP